MTDEATGRVSSLFAEEFYVTDLDGSSQSRAVPDHAGCAPSVDERTPSDRLWASSYADQMERPADTLTLRPLGRPDADVIAHWAADPAFCRAAGWTIGLPFVEHRNFHLLLIQSPPPELIRLGAIYEGFLVGYVDLHGDEPCRRELGFVIGERWRWSRGLGRLAGEAGLDYGFDRLGLRVIWAEALDANERSVRILQGLGFAETGRGDDGVFLDQPTYYRRFAMTANEWSSCHTH